MRGELAHRCVPGVPAPADPTLRILAALEARLGRIADDIVEAIWLELPGYAGQPDAGFREQVRANALETGSLAIRWLARDARAVPDEFALHRNHTHWPVSGITAPELTRAYQLGLAVVWGELEAIADADESARGVALGIAGRIVQLVLAVMAVHVGAMQEQNALLGEAEDELLDRDLFERLVAGQPPAAGLQREKAQRAGLEDQSRLVVVSAQFTDRAAATTAPRDLAVAVKHAIGAPDLSLAVILDDEVVAVVPVADDDGARALAQRLRELDLSGACSGYEAEVATGVSTVHHGLAGTGVAFAEARSARERAAGGGCVAFCEMSALQYLVSLGDTTAHRMVRESFRNFVEDDLAGGGDLVATLQAYAAADLNATLAAERLHMHVNTVRYRLARIEERAGCDLRTLADVLELLVAARFHLARRSAGSTELWVTDSAHE